MKRLAWVALFVVCLIAIVWVALVSMGLRTASEPWSGILSILAVGSITPTPVVVDGQVVVRNRMKVTLSSDHRAIDGAIAARFLQEVKRLLEEPFGLVL